MFIESPMEKINMDSLIYILKLLSFDNLQLIRLVNKKFNYAIIHIFKSGLVRLNKKAENISKCLKLEDEEKKKQPRQATIRQQRPAHLDITIYCKIQLQRTKSRLLEIKRKINDDQDELKFISGNVGKF